MSIIESFPKGSSSKVNINYQFAPIGTIISLMGKSAPEGYLVCDGSYYDIDTYKNLADYFQTQFGSANYFGGNGTTTFAVPDLRGEFLRGTGTNSHSNNGNGSNVGEHQDATQEAQSNTMGDRDQIRVTKNFRTQEIDCVINNTKTVSFIEGGAANTSDGLIYTSRPTNTSILWCIKATKTNDIQTTNYVYGYTPVGTIITMSGQCPQDFHECDGSILNISEYPELAEYYEQSFGTSNKYGGDGITTFAVPDLRGEFIRGAGENSHVDSSTGKLNGSGANVGVHQDATKEIYVRTDGGTAYLGNVTNGIYNTTTMDTVGDTSVYKGGMGSSVGSGCPGWYTARPTNTSVLFCVALKNIIPVESSESEETTGGHIISDNGTELDEQPVLNFTDFDIENDTENNETDIKTHRLTEEELDEIFDEQPNILGITPNIGFTPVGTIISVMGNSAPSNYLICDGTEVLIMEYPDLAKYFEEQFGTKNHFGGDGTTTFAVPDLRGEFLRGSGANNHIDATTGILNGSGANVGEHQDATKDIILRTDGSAAYIGKIANNITEPRDTDSQSLSNLQLEGNINVDSGSASYRGWFTVRPTNTSVLYCIAVKNIYIDPKYDYSTYEKVVGTWIDGKPLYQKTYELTNLNYSDDNDIGLTSLNIDTIVSYSGICIANNGTIYDINVPSNDSNYATGTFITSSKLLGMRFGSGIRNNYFNKTLFTIQYTKTTD